MNLRPKNPWKDFKTIGEERGDADSKGDWIALILLCGFAALLGGSLGVIVGFVLSMGRVADGNWSGVYLAGGGGAVLAVLYTLSMWFELLDDAWLLATLERFAVARAAITAGGWIWRVISPLLAALVLTFGAAYWAAGEVCDWTNSYERVIYSESQTKSNRTKCANKVFNRWPPHPAVAVAAGATFIFCISALLWRLARICPLPEE